MNYRLVRRPLIALTWALAMLTWGSIAHYLFGLPDIGPLLAVLAIALALGLPIGRRLRTASGLAAPQSRPLGQPH